MKESSQYVSPRDSNLSPLEWLKHETARQRRLGIRTGQRFVFYFEKDHRNDWFEIKERFEEPVPQEQ